MKKANFKMLYFYPLLITQFLGVVPDCIIKRYLLIMANVGTKMPIYKRRIIQISNRKKQIKPDYLDNLYFKITIQNQTLKLRRLVSYQM